MFAGKSTSNRLHIRLGFEGFEGFQRHFIISRVLSEIATVETSIMCMAHFWGSLWRWSTFESAFPVKLQYSPSMIKMQGGGIVGRLILFLY